MKIAYMIFVLIANSILIFAANVKVSDKSINVSPVFFGVNTLYWLQDDRTRNNEDLMKYLRDLKLEIMRYPGGEVADNFDWRTNTLNNPKEFPYEKSPEKDASNRMDFDEFISWKNRLGVKDATIVVNLEEAFVEHNLEKAARLAAAWVDYANNKKNYNIKYWEIGNESYHLKTRYPLTAMEYSKAFKVFYKYMKRVDPSIKLGAIGPLSYKKIPNISFISSRDLRKLRSIRDTKKRNRYIDEIKQRIKHHSKNNVSGSWWKILTEKIGDEMDFAVVHRYYSKRIKNSQFNIPLRFDRPVEKLRQFLKNNTGREIDIALTEWSFSKKSKLTSIYKSLTLAEMIGDYLKSGLLMTNYFMLYKKKKNYRALFDHRTLKPKPIYYVFKTFTHYTYDKILKTKSDERTLYALSSKDSKNGSLSLFLINKSSKEMNAHIELPEYYRPIESLEIDRKDLVPHLLKRYREKQSSSKWELSLDPLSLTVVKFEH